MLFRQNTITLNSYTSLREAAKLVYPDGAVVLPGSLGHIIEDHVNTVITNPSDLYGFEPTIILENYLNNTGIHAQQKTDNEFSYIIIRRLFPGDVYLIRAVAGDYTIGDRVFATQTANGVYVSLTGEGRFIGWVQEQYSITDSMVDIVDDGKTDVNNVFVNLVKVRVGSPFDVLSKSN